MRTKRIKASYEIDLSRFPNFHKTGSIRGMKRIYSEGALLVIHGSYIYNVTSEPEIYFNIAY
ncbi:hypothetical protein PF672P2_00057 [Parabacteroides phage PF672P2]|nr:hypothetical protein PF672P1_00014 [Parabacteroides phage PF672P1]WAX17194.1 hypothetical protein PF672P2_00057 [Parabacteroides phage PF672P2]